MFISTKGRYTLRVMIDLASHPGDRFVPLQEIADRQQISKEYLSSILKILVKAGQLTSLRGTGGGYKLCMAPEEYHIGTILRLVEGDLAPVPCMQDENTCPNSGKCGSFAMWNDLDNIIEGFLDSIVLSDFLEGGKYFKG